MPTMACVKFSFVRRLPPPATTPTREMAPLERLPQELLVRIASILRHGNTSDIIAMADLAALCLVSRRLCIIARDQLYKYPYIARGYTTRQGVCLHSHIFLFARTIVEQPSLFTEMHHLSMFLTPGVLKRRFRYRSEPLTFIQQCIDRLRELGGNNSRPSAEWIKMFKRRCPEAFYAGAILALAPPLLELTLRIDGAKELVELPTGLKVIYFGLRWSTKRSPSPSPSQAVKIAPRTKNLHWLFMGSDFFTGPLSYMDSITTLELNDMSMYYSFKNWKSSVLRSITTLVLRTSIWGFLHAGVWGFDSDPLRRLQALFLNSNSLDMIIESCQWHQLGGKVLKVEGTRWRFKNLMIRLRPMAHRLEHLSIKVVPKPLEESIDKWLPRIRRVNSLRHYVRLRSLAVPQDFFFKRSLCPHILESLSIYSLVPQSLERLEIMYPSRSIMVFLFRLAQWLACHSDWNLREVVLSYSKLLGDLPDKLVSEPVYDALARRGVNVRLYKLD
ncbi:hypothetical protein DM02DRAFT_627598 [Periconia macrospinosa]|uniref:F-box domain-containing protein n=1 Tax=Periconia macrospinosa TaxID=97972 RepID=A0A2V1DU02_9PLEO|nr:hypothetical protein DM02DRAFT_627598 [Periconia macrospinosa]